METYHKNRLIFWILIFLVLVNLAALGTYFFFPRGQKAMVNCDEEMMSAGCLYQNQLDLTDEQAKQVDILSKAYMQVSGPIAEAIKSTRGEILDEISATAPDTTNLDQLSEELSRLQNQLQRENIKHYMALKEVCSPDQAMRLSNLYRQLYGCPMQGPGKGMQHRHRRGL